MKKLILIALIVITGCATINTAPEIYDDAVNSVAVIYNGGSLGSGFFVGENIIATANHCIDDEGEIIVELKDDSSIYTATIIRQDIDSDLALIKVDTPYYVKPLPVSNENPVTGESCVAIGHPYGIKFSISKGIVSHINRENIYRKPIGFIQTDTPLNGGNSGGCVLNMQNKVIGVVSWGIQGSDGLGFLAPAKHLLRLMKNE